jgi:hypothetical protein
MTASNNQFGNDTGFLLDQATFNFAPSAPEQLRPEPTAEDTLELPVHPGIPEDEISNELLLNELQRATNLPRIPDQETLHLFETFVRIVRNGPTMQDDEAIANKNAEIGQLKELLLEAQETIISLLNDRVLDRSKISTLESQAKLLPDLQSQANRAMGLAIRSEDVQQELDAVRSEVERLRTSYMRSEQKKKGFLDRLFGK